MTDHNVFKREVHGALSFLKAQVERNENLMVRLQDPKTHDPPLPDLFFEKIHAALNKFNESLIQRGNIMLETFFGLSIDSGKQAEEFTMWVLVTRTVFMAGLQEQVNLLKEMSVAKAEITTPLEGTSSETKEEE